MKKFLLMCLAIYALGMAIYYTKQDRTIHGKRPILERFFDSSLFQTYQSGLIHHIPPREKVVHPQLSQLSAIVHHIKHCTANENHCRLESIVQLKRACIAAHHEMNQADQKILENFCFWERTQNDFKSNFKHLLQQFLTAERKPNVHTMLWSSYLQLAKNSHLKGHLNSSKSIHDAHGQGYVVSNAFSAGETQYILMPQITQESASNEIAVIPEFTYYLQILKKRGARHLYVNLAERLDQRQKPMVDAIEHLVDDSTLWVITLDKDSHFYHQTFPYSDENNAEEFKTIFMSRLFEEDPSKSTFFWPEHLLASNWKQQCSDILEEVHHEYFQDRVSLSLAERKDFIELSYCAMVSSLCKNLHIQYANMTCKLCVDRGPTAMAAMLCYEYSKQNRALQEQEVTDIVALALVPAVVSYNRAPHRDRVERLCNLTERLTK